MSANETKDDKPLTAARPDREVITHHEVRMGERTLSYTATAARMALPDVRDEHRASIFSVSYVLDGVEDPSRRPVTFCFNGGPGSSSVWLHLGAFGPRRAAIPDVVAVPPPPYRLEDNAHGLLDLTDLVFIDPVGTGFSRPQGKTEAKAFHSIADDVASVGEFIERWLSRNKRWNSPRLLAGESYGTTRAAGLASHLAARGLALNGLVLVSVAMDFHTFIAEPGNVLPAVLYLPTFAALAWYHRRLDPHPPELAPLLDEVRDFALEAYAPALLHGSRLPEERRREVAERLQRYTSLPATLWLELDLQLDAMGFARRLPGDGRRTVGRLDGRYLGWDPQPDGSRATEDPAYDAAAGPYTALANVLLRQELGFDGDDLYEVLSLETNRNWSWKREGLLGYPNTAEDLRRAMLANPHLRVFLANGLYDLATPFFAAEHSAATLGLPRALAGNVEQAWYEAGHMMYFHPASLEKLKADLVGFYQRSTGT